MSRSSSGNPGVFIQIIQLLRKLYLVFLKGFLWNSSRIPNGNFSSWCIFSSKKRWFSYKRAMKDNFFSSKKLYTGIRPQELIWKILGTSSRSFLSSSQYVSREFLQEILLKYSLKFRNIVEYLFQKFFRMFSQHVFFESSHELIWKFSQKWLSDFLAEFWYCY